MSTVWTVLWPTQIPSGQQEEVCDRQPDGSPEQRVEARVHDGVEGGAGQGQPLDEGHQLGRGAAALGAERLPAHVILGHRGALLLTRQRKTVQKGK